MSLLPLLVGWVCLPRLRLPLIDRLAQPSGPLPCRNPALRATRTQLQAETLQRIRLKQRQQLLMPAACREVPSAPAATTAVQLRPRYLLKYRPALLIVLLVHPPLNRQQSSVCLIRCRIPHLLLLFSPNRLRLLRREAHLLSGHQMTQPLSPKVLFDRWLSF